jgi:hypothetical protein
MGPVLQTALQSEGRNRMIRNTEGGIDEDN